MQLLKKVFLRAKCLNIIRNKNFNHDLFFCKLKRNVVKNFEPSFFRVVKYFKIIQLTKRAFLN